ncbi:MAG: class I SAM-dependent methyltransferase [Coriobacteriales bacterium]|nr:class I SAM-dependent methyltransferase [Coriobacteriales bacterium]
MKHDGQFASEHTSTVLRWLRDDLGISVAESVVSLSLQYLHCILAESTATNLTSVKDPRDAARLHVLDSLAALPAVAGAPDGTLVDLGTGAGFPGVPLALATGRPTVLLDSIGRKIRAVQSCVGRTLGVDGGIRGVVARSEEYARDNGADAAVVTARAVANLPVLLELARPLLTADGVFVALKGAPTREEIDRGVLAANVLGFVQLNPISFTLPGGGERRTLLPFRVVRDSRVAIPRRPGMAAKRPVA